MAHPTDDIIVEYEKLFEKQNIGVHLWSDQLLGYNKSDLDVKGFHIGWDEYDKKWQLCCAWVEERLPHLSCARGHVTKQHDRFPLLSSPPQVKDEALYYVDSLLDKAKTRANEFVNDFEKMLLKAKGIVI